MITRRSVTLLSLAALTSACVPSGGGGGAARGPSGETPPPRPVPNAGWDAWVQGYKARAAGRGISPGVIDTAFRGAGFLPDVIEKDRNQTEFKRSTEDYLNIAASDERVSLGRQKYAAYGSTLNALQSRYGVDAQIIAAVWGLESFFGTRRGNIPVISALSTLAYEGRRGAFFEGQLTAALRILQRGDTTADRMVGSWAGAMGHTQFIPTSYLEFAVDYTGDGRADIWNSQVDTLASIANYLANHGWVKGRDWGFEVTVPASVSCALEGPDRGKRISDWAALGVQRVSGRPFPEHEARQEGFLLMPAGRSGPAFIVTPNFYVLKAYNESDLYALFVGHAADRIAYGDRAFSGSWTRMAKMYRSDIAAMQRGLERQGYDVGGADGLPGFRTRRSIGEWQAKAGRAPTCFPEAGIINALK